MGRTSTRALIFRLMLLLYIVVVGYLCIHNFRHLPPNLPKEIFGIPIDKAVHFCMFLPFPILTFYSFDNPVGSPGQAIATALYMLSFGCIFAGITEILQGMTPYRSEDIRDFAADAVAIGLATLVIFILNFIKTRRRKR